MPEALRPKVDKGGGSKYEMRFPEINSTIYTAIEVRGGTNHRLHLSEAAFMEENRIKASLESVPLRNSRITYESTPNGMGNHFYEDWVDKECYDEKMFFPWFLHHEYQIEGSPIKHKSPDEIALIKMAKKEWDIDLTDDQIHFRRMKQKSLKDLFLQEYPENDVECFLSSANAAMDLKQIKEFLDKTPDADDVDGFKIFKPIDKKTRYVIGADTAEGHGGDYSVAHVIDVETLELVATARSNRWKPKEFAQRISKLAKLYSTERKKPLVAVERNNHGHAVIAILEEVIQYPNLFKHNDDRVGWKTDSVTRPVAINAFIDAVENGHLHVYSVETLQECLTLVNKDGKIEAEDGKNDDCIMAASIGLQVAIQEKSGMNTYDNLQMRIRI
jgi:hypothetical protein